MLWRVILFERNILKKITVVFGCGGQRDKKKRELMGKIASKYCKKIYITDDNPRNESPKKLERYYERIEKFESSKEILNEKKAMLYAVVNSEPYEIILIAGKGHETYQDLKRKVFLRQKDCRKL